MKDKCYVCNLQEGEKDPIGDIIELRPYGPNGEWICFNCMITSPEREVDADKHMRAVLDNHKHVVIGEKTGIRPLTKGIT